MENILENFWYYYQETYCSRLTEEERAILDMLNENEENLLATLGGEAKNRLKICEKCMTDLLCIAERKAFEEGVRFTADFLLDALRKGRFFERK